MESFVAAGSSLCSLPASFLAQQKESPAQVLHSTMTFWFRVHLPKDLARYVQFVRGEDHPPFGSRGRVSADIVDDCLWLVVKLVEALSEDICPQGCLTSIVELLELAT